ncbi:winged helix-turn-helix domain-containing protein [Pseudoalteromonas sp. C2R02]|uniref:winged helix-turn-helix domain-containing protein n=1 Tax=Pseudoalteromonas sp. C2R02 TaxID=2841565 RepID=UPI001C09C471|nr:winged helix-turn-helix domain-containing protein [Pseudoalteromonas sp. C2R02]MBU2970811.1 winged helix-turn-helix domain-containing protein [Pseudoalteromonas sp. C2R02]
MIQFGGFILDRKQTRLLYQDKELAIDPKLFELLMIFVSQPNTIISRDYILEHLWSGSIVTDNAINKLIANLRKVLGDDPKQPQYIQTVPKRGYRLICEVTLVETSNTRPQIAQQNTSIKKVRLSTFSIVTIAVILMLSSVLLWQVVSSTEQPNYKADTIELTRSKGAEKSARMHPDKKHLYYLKMNSENIANQLWVKNIHSSKVHQVDIGKATISSIVAVTKDSNDETTYLFYFDKTQDTCGVYKARLTANSQIEQSSQANLVMNWKQNDKLFDCGNKRIKDIDYHETRQEIYYAAQPQDLWPNQIYLFDLKTENHRFVTQDEPKGWGHHGIDISPDGNKLLIMSTDSNYKTQLLALDLASNKITKGFKFNHPVIEAIWHHDSEQVLYYAAPPLHKIIKSDLYGKNATTVVSVSEYLSSQMSLFPDGRNLLFSTEQKNFSNRWLIAPESMRNIDNSSVYDVNPALFHNSSNYLFVSKRSGRRQLYLGRQNTHHAQIVTNFSELLPLNYLSLSADDQSILINIEDKVYHISISDLNTFDPAKEVKKEQLIFTSEHPIISLDWLTTNSAAITIVKNGTPELKLINLANNREVKLEGKWAYGIRDSKHLVYSYLIEQHTNALYRINTFKISDEIDINQHNLTHTQLTLPKGFFHVKVDSNTLYYGSGENDGDYLNAIPLNGNNESNKYLINDFNSYDVYNGKIMLSDIESIEGDVHRSLY